MGNEQSGTSDGGENYGFRVLGIQENSPACNVGFVSFFDFIVGVDGIRLDQRDTTFMELIANSEDKTIQLDVFNVKSQTHRQITMTPTQNWPGKGLLGVTIRFDCFEGAEDQVLHVLDIEKHSPAELAGLQAYKDYLLGTPERIFQDPNDLHDEIVEKLEHELHCYVYNAENDQVRIVSIMPNARWGGSGMLGAEVGFGYLHRIPSDTRQTNGTSVGYLSMAADAIAATDKFVRHRKSDDETSESKTNEVENNPKKEEDVKIIETESKSSIPSDVPIEQVKNMTMESSINEKLPKETKQGDLNIREDSTSSTMDSTNNVSASNLQPSNTVQHEIIHGNINALPISTVETIAENPHS